MSSSNAQGRPRPDHSGSVPSTVGGNSFAKRLSAIYWRPTDLPPIMHLDKITGEHAEFYFNKFSTWAATRPVPYNFNDQLLPTNPKNRQCAETIFLLGYVGKHLKETRLLFPDHPDWAQVRDIDKQFSYLYSEQIKLFKTQHKRFKISQSDGDIFLVLKRFVRYIVIMVRP